VIIDPTGGDDGQGTFTPSDGSFNADDFPDLPDGLDSDSVSAPDPLQRICKEDLVKAELRVNRPMWQGAWDAYGGEPDFVYDCVLLEDRSGTATIAESTSLVNENYVIGVQLKFTNGEKLNLQPLDVTRDDSAMLPTWRKDVQYWSYNYSMDYADFDLYSKVMADGFYLKAFGLYSDTQ